MAPRVPDASADVAIDVQAAAGWTHPTPQPLPAWPATNSPTPLPALPPPLPQIAQPPNGMLSVPAVVPWWPEIPRVVKLLSWSFWAFVLSHLVFLLLMPQVLDWVPRSPLPMLLWSIAGLGVLVACSRSFYNRMSEIAPLHGGDFTPKRTRLVLMVTHGLVMLLMAAVLLSLVFGGEALRLPAEREDTWASRFDFVEVCLVVTVVVLMRTTKTIALRRPWSPSIAIPRAMLTVSCDFAGSIVVVTVARMATDVLLSTFGEVASRATKEG
ncbi:unnamed protein product [Vitrella brassicaformis CCMP3155]|uniref:Uncharacterized protein n=1 Tax=Vitrella brassicaformis (strain CCMP3155) TaxID=1169540 RepID=A0A0G4EQH9_VITBC|nr:unnamed protein product [Vitrella brassicaformis CCMP3155]|eukprot:CEL99694.1 unnamed protein product [Vitrella brassicaformis CCMP3155]